jgi:hypothetical protein
LIGIVLSAILAEFVCAPSVATADVGGTGNFSASPSPTGNGVDVNVTVGTGSPGSGSAPESNGITCVATPLATLNDPSIPDPGLSGGVTGTGQVIAPGTPGTWVLSECFNSTGALVSAPQPMFIPQGQPVDPQQLLQEARRHLALPGPSLQLSPPVGQWQYVQMPTWAWVPRSTWIPLAASASAGGVTVSVRATPVRLDLTYQTDGTGAAATVSCVGPGTPFDVQLAEAEDPGSPVQASSPDCGWTWKDSSVDTPDQKYAVSGHVVYHVLWSVTGAAGGGDLGELPGQDTAFRLSVGEIQAVNTPPR